jgi:hypothetical protein
MDITKRKIARLVLVTLIAGAGVVVVSAAWVVKRFVADADGESDSLIDPERIIHPAKSGSTSRWGDGP